LGVQFSTTLANINKIFLFLSLFFWQNLLEIILCQTSVIVMVPIFLVDKKNHGGWKKQLPSPISTTK
jgi:hypothetical protein